MQQIFVSILNFNGKDNTIECLKSLEKNSRDNFNLKILVIDNGSSDGSVEEIKNYIEKNENKQACSLVLLENKENLGFSGGHNVGIKYALENGGDAVVILNNDTIVDKNLISELLKVPEDAGIVAPKIYFYKGFEFHKGRYKEDEKGRVFWYAGGIMDFRNVIGHHRGVDEVDDGQYDVLQNTDFASGCCMLIKKEVFEKVGLFDDRYFLYYEDNDLSQRAKSSNFKIIYNPKALLWHKNAGSVGGSGSSVQDYYITRNRMLFGMKFVPLRSKISLLKESLNLLLRGRPWQKKGIVDFYLGKFGKGSYKI